MSRLALHPGLAWLLRQAPRTLWRSVRRRFTGVKGALLFLVVLVFLLAILAPAAIQMLRADQTDVSVSADRARTFAPLALLAMTAMTMLAPAQRRGGLYFKPPEVGLLFPAPISRRQLLAYHVLSRAQIQILSAIWVAVFVVQYAPTWYGCFVALLCALLFLQLLSQTVALLTAAAGQRVAAPLRWVAMGAIVLALVAGGSSALAEVRLDRGPEAAAYALAAHPLVQVVTLPFVPFANTFAATSFVEVLQWGVASVTILVVLVAIIARLDVAYEEAALDVSRNVRRSLERMRAGGGAMAVMGPTKARFSVPRLPHFGGAGAIAWRQCIEIVRNARAVASSMLIILAWPAIAGGAVMLSSGGLDEQASHVAAGAVIPAVLMFTVVFTQNISFDFRRDLDRIAFLRSLPLSSLAIATGQVAPVSVLLAGMQFVVIFALVALLGVMPLAVTPAFLPLLLLFSWAVIAIDNALFLVFPHRFDPDDAGNVGFMGKLMLVMFLKFLVLIVVMTGAVLAGVAAGAAMGLALGAGDGAPQQAAIVVGALVSLAVLVVANVVLTYLVALAYDAFDPGRDVPA